MKKIGLLTALVFGTAVMAQEEEYKSLVNMRKEAEQGAVKFVKSLDQNNSFTTYYRLNEDESTVVGDFPFKELKSGEFNMDNVIGYIFTYELKPEFYPVAKTHDLKFKLYINKKLEVDYSEQWNSKWSRAVSGNLEVNYDNLPEEKDKEFILAQLDFIQKLKDKQVHTMATLDNYLRQNYSDKKFREPELTRLSYPPYSVHFEVVENQCTKCVKLEIPVDSFENIEKSSVTVVGI